MSEREGEVRKHTSTTPQMADRYTVKCLEQGCTWESPGRPVQEQAVLDFESHVCVIGQGDHYQLPDGCDKHKKEPLGFMKGCPDCNADLFETGR